MRLTDGLVPVFVCVFLTLRYHDFVCLEMIHGQPEFCPGASMQALTKVPLMHC